LRPVKTKYHRFSGPCRPPHNLNFPRPPAPAAGYGHHPAVGLLLGLAAYKAWVLL